MKTSEYDKTTTVARKVSDKELGEGIYRWDHEMRQFIRVKR